MGVSRFLRRPSGRCGCHPVRGETPRYRCFATLSQPQSSAALPALSACAHRAQINRLEPPLQRRSPLRISTVIGPTPPLASSTRTSSHAASRDGRGPSVCWRFGAASRPDQPVLPSSEKHRADRGLRHAESGGPLAFHDAIAGGQIPRMISSRRTTATDPLPSGVCWDRTKGMQTHGALERSSG